MVDDQTLPADTPAGLDAEAVPDGAPIVADPFASAADADAADTEATEGEVTGVDDAEVTDAETSDSETSDAEPTDAETSDSEPTDAEAAEPVDEDDPNVQLRALLESDPGEWYVVHSYAGYERRVKQNIELARRNQDLEDEVFRVEVPMETVWEIKKGERKRVERVKLPGYVLVLMEHSARSWTAIRNTPGVTGFVGHGDKPIPLSIDDVYEMLKSPERAVTTGPEARQQGTTTAAPTITSEFHSGDVVEVTDGPFATLTATISEVNPEAQRVTAMVELFGRETPVELRFDQITAV